MLRARSLSLEILLVFCLSSRPDWVLRRSRRKVSFSRSVWFTLVVICARRSCCRSNCLERSFNCSSRRSSSSASRRGAKNSRFSTESVMEPTVDVKGGVLIVLTSIASGRTRGGTGEHRLQSWMGSVLPPSSITGLDGAQSAEKPTKNERRRLWNAGWIITLFVEGTTRTTWYGVRSTIYTVSPGATSIDWPLAVRTQDREWGLKQQKCWKRFIKNTKMKGGNFLTRKRRLKTSWVNSRTRRKGVAGEPEPSTKRRDKKTSVSSTGQ